MLNQWWHQLRGKKRQDLKALALVIGIIGIIGYLLVPNFFENIYWRLNPDLTATSLNNLNLSGTYDSNTLNSSNYSIPNFPYAYNTYNENRENDIRTGYWILFGASGTIQQFSVSSQDYTFFQRLIEKDSRGDADITVFLVNTGQISQYKVSNELFGIISNAAIIEQRSPNSSLYSYPNSSAYPYSDSSPYSYPDSSPYPYSNSSPYSDPNSPPYSSPNIGS